MVCLEYLEEAFPDSQNRLMPPSAEGRAQARYWCVYINEKVIPHYYKMLMRPTLEEQDAAKRDLTGTTTI
jgi:glutathione S-transferase